MDLRADESVRANNDAHLVQHADSAVAPVVFNVAAVTVDHAAPEYTVKVPDFTELLVASPVVHRFVTRLSVCMSVTIVCAVRQFP